MSWWAWLLVGVLAYAFAVSVIVAWFKGASSASYRRPGEKP